MSAGWQNGLSWDICPQEVVRFKQQESPLTKRVPGSPPSASDLVCAFTAGTKAGPGLPPG